MLNWIKAAPFKQSRLTPAYKFNVKAGRYTNESGKFIKRAVILDAVDKQVSTSKRNIARLSNQLKREKIDLSEWRDGMVKEIKTLHTAQYALGKGGWANLKHDDYGRIGVVVKGQLKYLNGFVRDIRKKYESPTDLDGRFLLRAQLYGQAGRPTFIQSERVQRQEQQVKEERRILTAAEHCDDCVNAAERDWQLIGILPAIGDSACNVNCKCMFEYR